MVRFRSFRSKLQTAFLALGLLAILVTGWEASEGAASSLRQATYDRLTAIRETKCRRIERYFEDVSNHVLALSSDESTITALEEFRSAWQELPVQDEASERERLLRDYYNTSFGPRLPPEFDRAETIERWFPDEPRTRTLQHFFLSANPHPVGSKDLLLSVPQAGRYGRAHARYHPTLHRYQTAFGFYDIFLIDAAEGRILYSVFKEIDLGAKLTTEPYRTTGLAKAFERAMALKKIEEYVIEDYTPYVASYFAPAAFIAAPVRRAGSKIGVLAIQVSVDEINRVMTGDHKWREEGLGETGQTYIVGADNTLRSDLRFDIEQPEDYFARLERAGVSRQVIEAVRRNRTAILALTVAPGVAERIRSGRKGTEMGVGLDGVPVLRSYAPLAIPQLDWALVAEIDATEALQPVTALRRRIFWSGVLATAIFYAAAWMLARTVTRPVLALADGARRLGDRDFAIRVPVESEDEIGQLASVFNRMIEQLEQTTVSKEELDRVLGSLINAVFVINTKSGDSVAEMLKAPVREANSAALDLLRTTRQELIGKPFGELFEGDGSRAEELLKYLVQSGRLPAVETSLLSRTGPVPVLFTAALLPEEPGRSSGIICAAQDITDWKTAQDQFRRLSKVFREGADPIVLADLDGRISDCNAEAERVYGWKRDELRGQTLEVLAPPERREELQQALRLCLNGSQIRNAETVQVNCEGREVPVLMTLSLLMGENARPAGIAVICKDITARKQAESALRQKQQELEALARRLITAQEEERSRLARELHDDLTQRLAAVAIETGRLQQQAKSLDAERWKASLDGIKQQIMRLSNDVHGLSRRLHPSMIDDLDLTAAIESECRSFFERGGPPVEFVYHGDFADVPKPVQLALYRIVQEGLRNVSRHSAADDVRLHLERRGDLLELTLEDSGQGFDRDDPNWRPGLGLASMEERARLLGGQLTVHSRRGEGTRIYACVPAGGTDEQAKIAAGGRS